MMCLYLIRWLPCSDIGHSKRSSFARESVVGQLNWCCRALVLYKFDCVISDMNIEFVESFICVILY